MNFAVVLLPLASWHKPLPYPPKYRAMIEEFCKQNRNADGQEVPLYDLSAIASDNDFGDHIHMNERPSKDGRRADGHRPEVSGKDRGLAEPK